VGERVKVEEEEGPLEEEKEGQRKRWRRGSAEEKTEKEPSREGVKEGPLSRHDEGVSSRVASRIVDSKRTARGGRWSVASHTKTNITIAIKRGRRRSDRLYPYTQ